MIIRNKERTYWYTLWCQSISCGWGSPLRVNSSHTPTLSCSCRRLWTVPFVPHLPHNCLCINQHIQMIGFWQSSVRGDLVWWHLGWVLYHDHSKSQSVYCPNSQFLRSSSESYSSDRSVCSTSPLKRDQVCKWIAYHYAKRKRGCFHYHKTGYSSSNNCLLRSLWDWFEWCLWRYQSHREN